MDTHELLALLVRHREQLRQWLDEDQYRHFLAMTERLREVGDDPERAGMAVMAIVRALWPVPDEAGVLAELLHADHRSIATTTTVPTPEAVLAALEELYAAPAAGEQDRTEAGAAGPVTVGPVSADPEGGDPLAADSVAAAAADDDPDPVAAVIAAARRRLLTVPSRAAAPAGSPAAGDGPADVIVLADPEDGPRSPEFQFDPDTGQPRDIVVRINRILLADRDPWGAADWWLGRNSWLGGPPASLLGRVPDDRLADAALALVEEGGR
ncbi:hypothetical protein P1P75_32970 [Streptomyces sp. ID05-39B]|uniref:hypothetical protein n=1 Tax=Streptomyces sp. ID05-39B TaxID=3028664 RepID=UPI0029A321BE|nr:hypothetical protein [Streptomyces sp. ID05-39B]MDX3531092.1 hypothetical protein [Streptomyces sp. ID05-39B]